MMRADAGDGRVDAMTPVVIEASTARRDWSLFKLRAVDALCAGEGANALAFAMRLRVMAVENFMMLNNEVVDWFGWRRHVNVWQYEDCSVQRLFI